MNIAIITDSFPPLKNSGAIQIRDLSLEFVRQGHKILVLIPSSEINTPYLLEEVDRVKILRLKAPKIKNIGYFRRAIGEYLMPFIILSQVVKLRCVGSATMNRHVLVLPIMVMVLHQSI